MAYCMTEYYLVSVHDKNKSKSDFTKYGGTAVVKQQQKAAVKQEKRWRDASKAYASRDASREGVLAVASLSFSRNVGEAHLKHTHLEKERELHIHASRCVCR